MAEMTGFQRLIGGLLGENMEGMTEEQRRRLAREGGTAAILGMLSGSGLLGGLEGLRARRKEQATEAEAARRTAAAEAEMPRIAGRLFGGTAGTLESLPGGEGGPLTSRYRQDPQEALARLYSTQEGRDVATMAPDLAKLASESVTGVTVGGSRLYPLTGKFVKEPEAPKPRVRVGETDLTDKVIVFYSDGTTETFPKGAAPRAAGGGGGGAPRAAGGGGGGAPRAAGGGDGGMFLTPEETAAAGFAPGTIVRRRDGTVVQRPPAAGATPTEGPMAGMNERQRSGASIVRDAALQYAANITGMSLEEVKRMTPVQIEDAINRKGGRVLQGGRARMLTNLPGVGDFARGVVESANADLIGPSTSGGAGVAMTQNPTGPITGPDVDIGIRQFPNPMLPVDVQAQMIRSLLERGGVVEQYDEKGNKVTR